VNEKYSRIGGNSAFPMGMPVGNGLCQKSAQELGLLPGTPVGIGIIDAHAGGLGLVTYKYQNKILRNF
jgi:D-ribulokinase